MRDALKGTSGLESPSVGIWRPAVGLGAPLEPGVLLGYLERAGARLGVVAPPGSAGVAIEVVASGRWVEYGSPLVSAGEGTARGAAPTARLADLPEGVEVITADTDGTIWLRQKPGQPPFTSPGASVAPRDTLALVEVMKTFSPVRAPFSGVVERICVADGVAVEAGAPMFWIRRTP